MTVLSMPKVQSLLTKIIVWTFIFNISACTVLYVKNFIIERFTPITYAKIKVEASGITVLGPSTEGLIEYMKNQSLDPVVVRKIKRKPFTVDGRLISLASDNLQVFEYADTSTALKDALLFKEKYILRDDMHIYVDDLLVIYYMGKDEVIMKALEVRGNLI